MKKNKVTLFVFIVFTMIFSIIPTAVPQKGVYTFHGAAGNQKILKVRTVNNASLAALFGVNWTDVIEIFGPGAANVGARKKSVVTAVYPDYVLNASLWGLGLLDSCLYITDNWDWTTEDFANTPDSTGDGVQTLYDPTNLTAFVNVLFTSNVTVQNAGAMLAQLPTPVAQYLGALIWAPKWGATGNMAVHNAVAGDYLVNYVTAEVHFYLEDCTETWTWDTTFGAWIGYEIQDDEGTTIYEFTVELPTGTEIPGFELLALLGVTSLGIISLIYIVLKKKR